MKSFRTIILIALLSFLWGWLRLLNTGHCEEKYKRMVIIIDNSKSMSEIFNKNPKIEVVKREVVNLIESLPPETWVAIYATESKGKNSCGVPMVIHPLKPLEDKENVIQKVKALEPNHKFSFSLNFQKALQEIGSSNQEHALIVFTDGKEVCKDEILEESKKVRSQKMKVVFFPFGINTNEKQDQVLQSMVENISGDFFLIQEEKRFKKIMTKFPEDSLLLKPEIRRWGQIATSKRYYQNGDAVKIKFSGLPRNYRDWIALSKPGDPNDQFFWWKYTNGRSQGNFNIENLPSGKYEARVYINWPDAGYKIFNRFPFQILKRSEKLVFQTNKKKYSADEDIIVEFENLPANDGDWMTIVEASKPEDTYGEWVFIAKKRHGRIYFNPLPPGNYEARLYYDWPDGKYFLKEKFPFKVVKLPFN